MNELWVLLKFLEPNHVSMGKPTHYYYFIGYVVPWSSTKKPASFTL